MYSANHSIKKTQCVGTHHSGKYTHRHKHNVHTHTHTRVHLDLWKCLLKKESFELSFEVRDDGEILQTDRQQIPDSWNNETERTVTNRFENALKDFQKFPTLEIHMVSQRASAVFYLYGGSPLRNHMGRSKLQLKVNTRRSNITDPIDGSGMIEQFFFKLMQQFFQLIYDPVC